MANTRPANTQAANTPDVVQATGPVAKSLVSGTPVLSKPVIAQTQVLTALNLASGTPVLTKPALTQIVVLTARNLADGIPLLGNPTLTQISAGTLTALNLTAGTPILQTPDIGPLLPSAVIRGAPVWWRGWPYDEDEPEEEPPVVNEIIEVPESAHETPTEPEVIAKAPRVSYVSQPRYDNVVREARNAIAGELEMMREEQRSRREARARVEAEVRKRVKRMKDDEEVLLLS